MKIGVSTASLFGRYETEDALPKIQSLGADCAEVFLQTFYEYRPEFSKMLSKEQNGFPVCSVHTATPNFEPNLFNVSRRIRGDGFYWCDQVLRSAQLLGAKSYVLHGFIRPLARREDDFDFLAERFNEAIGFFHHYGINLCLENVWWSIYDRLGVFRELKSRCPDLMSVFDIKQARRMGADWKSLITEMGQSISHVHLSDVDASGKMCLPGKGTTDFLEVFKRLQGEGFNGPAIIEVYRNDFQNEKELQQSIQYLKEISDKLR